jgi:hypothetical protein
LPERLGSIRAPGGRRGIAGDVFRVGLEDVGAGFEVRQDGHQTSRTRFLAGLHLGRQLDPLLGIQPPVLDLAGGWA